MKNVVKYCVRCQENPSEYKAYYGEILSGYIDLACVGYYTVGEEENWEFCKVHPDEKLVDSPLSASEFGVLSSITNDILFIHSMEDLKQSDPIEFQLKMSQFKANLGQQEIAREERNKIRCPKCNSIQITTGARGVSHFWGFIGASKTVNRCAKCGHTWKP